VTAWPTRALTYAMLVNILSVTRATEIRWVIKLAYNVVLRHCMLTMRAVCIYAYVFVKSASPLASDVCNDDDSRYADRR
jgi:hypothetical protein